MAEKVPPKVKHPLPISAEAQTSPSLLKLILLMVLVLFSPISLRSQAVRVQARRISPHPELLLCVLCSLTVSATPSTVTFTLVKLGTATGSVPIVITTSEAGISLQTSMKLFGYFSSTTAALTDGRATPNNIPTSAVLGQMTTGSPTSYTAFTGSNALGPAGAGLLLFSTASLGVLGCMPSIDACRTDSLNLQINLSGLPQLPAGTYTGSLILQAQVM